MVDLGEEAMDKTTCPVCKGTGVISRVKPGIDSAISRALTNLDKWNDVAGAVEKYTGHYYELQSVIVDAVHYGFQRALSDDERFLTLEKNELSCSIQRGMGVKSL